MAKNIQMQYYNGSTYEVVYPQVLLTNVTGTLPIANGGTGATTAANARNNLSVYSKSETSSLLQSGTNGMMTIETFKAVDRVVNFDDDTSELVSFNTSKSYGTSTGGGTVNDIAYISSSTLTASGDQFLVGNNVKATLVVLKPILASASGIYCQLSSTNGKYKTSSQSYVTTSTIGNYTFTKTYSKSSCAESQPFRLAGSYVINGNWILIYPGTYAITSTVTSVNSPFISASSDISHSWHIGCMYYTSTEAANKVKSYCNVVIQ